MFDEFIDKYKELFKEETKVCPRKDFALFFFIAFVINILVLFIATSFSANTILGKILVLIYLLLCLVTFVSFIVLGIKRLHDANLSGWLIFIPVLLFCETVTSNNKYLNKEDLMSVEDKKENDNLEKFIELLEKNQK